LEGLFVGPPDILKTPLATWRLGGLLPNLGNG
jgi:hypothetical protein